MARASTVPVAVARSLAREPKSPMTTAPTTQNAPSPMSGEMPSSTAPVAPGNPMWPSAWAANSPWRTTTK